jgi:D-glycero-D-manno-heptose 1,7-bisphosphate phosphatase
MGIDLLRRAVFLDRDGVLNRALTRDSKPYPPSSLKELEILPGVREACGDLRQAGFLLIMVTNQPDVARGNQRREVVEVINRAVCESLCLDDIKVCYHDNLDHCSCRKPKPGLLFEAAQDWNINLSESFMVGDRWKDIDAGRRAGCKTIFIRYAYSETKPQVFDLEAGSLAESVEWILRETRS